MSKPRTIQLMRPGAYGDILMCTAAFPALKNQGYSIRFVAHPQYADILEDHPLIDELIQSKRGTRRDILSELADLPAAEKNVYLYYPFYARQELPPHPIPLHLASYFCEQAGVQPGDELSVHLSDERIERAKQCADRVLIHTQSRWSPYKDWPEDRWLDLVARIRTECGVEVMQLCGDDDRVLDGIERVESPSILDAIAAVSQCRLLIAGDSVFNHASRAVRKPSIIIWGSTHPQGMGYRQNINLVNGVDWQPEMGNHGPALQCQPCYREYPKPDNGNVKNPCPYTVPYPAHVLPKSLHVDPVLSACLASTAVETVFHHVRAMLSDPQHVQKTFSRPFSKNLP